MRIARLTSAISGKSIMLPWNGIHVPIWKSAVSGSLTAPHDASRWPPPAAPVAKSEGTMTRKRGTTAGATHGVLCGGGGRVEGFPDDAIRAAALHDHGEREDQEHGELADQGEAEELRHGLDVEVRDDEHERDA